MPIPQPHFDQLSAGLRYSDQRLASLEAAQADISKKISSPAQPQLPTSILKATLADISSEIEVHNTGLQLGRDPKVLAMLGEVHDDPALADQIKSNPQGFVQSRGIQLPPGVTITANRPTPQSAMVSANYDVGRFRISLQYDKDKGFSGQAL